MYVSQAHLDLVYCQGTGCLYLADDQDGRALLCRGYSGHGSGRNDPTQEAVKAIGPIPRGVWRVEAPRHHPRLGDSAFPLLPVGHNAHGRTGFYIHGDNRKADGSASTGCIIAPRFVREAIGALGIRCLLVEEFVP